MGLVRTDPFKPLAAVLQNYIYSPQQEGNAQREKYKVITFTNNFNCISKIFWYEISSLFQLIY